MTWSTLPMGSVLLIVGLLAVIVSQLWLLTTNSGSRKRFRAGTVYVLRVRRRGLLWWLPARGYIGQTRHRDYRTRINQHLYGYWYGGVWYPPKYWAADVVDYYPLMRSDRWCDWGLNFREMVAIRCLAPVHNGTFNHGNPRRVIPPPVELRCYPAPEQVTAVERCRRSGRSRGPSQTRRRAGRAASETPGAA